MTVDSSGVVTSFSGTASGFDGGVAIFNGPVALGQSSGGPSFFIDDKFSTTPDYFSTGNNTGGGGLGLTTTANPGTNYNFRIYDYTDTFNNYGVYTAWFGDSGGSPSTVTFTAIPEPATWALMTLGFVCLGRAAYGSRRRRTIVAVR